MLCITVIIFTLLTVAVLCNGDLPCNKVKAEFGYICVCNSSYCDTINTPKKLPQGQFHLYYTSDENPGFNYQNGFFKMQAFSPHGIKYEVNTSQLFQKIRGFGGAFTDSFGAVYNSLSNGSQENLLRSFFSESGIEYTMCRVVLGSSDFSLRNYTYLPNFDPSLKSFNLTKDDYNYKIPQIKRALEMTKRQIYLLGSTWTSPEWMKINEDSRCGFLKKEFHQLWADYYVKCLDAFNLEGIEFWGLTTGNEPLTLYLLQSPQTLIMFPEEQRDWTVNNLGPALKKTNYKTKLIIMDDERAFAYWWLETVMRNPIAKEYVAGIGLHWYYDQLFSPKIIDHVHEKFPDQEVLYTESSVNPAIAVNLDTVRQISDILHDGKTHKKVTFDPVPPQLGSWKRAVVFIRNIIENLNHWVTTYMDWNLSLNTDGGPNIYNSPSCDAGIIVNDTEDSFYKNPMFYAMGHFSKFIQPDSIIFQIKISNDTYKFDYKEPPPISPPEPSTTTMFPFPTTPLDVDVVQIGAINPDGSKAIIFYNPKTYPVEIIVDDPERGYAFVILQPKSISSIIYW